MRAKSLYVLMDKTGKNFLRIENDERGYTKVSKCKNWINASHYSSYNNAFNIGATELNMGEPFKVIKISIKDFEIEKL